jgi:hypothetical protein
LPDIFAVLTCTSAEKAAGLATGAALALSELSGENQEPMDETKFEKWTVYTLDFTKLEENAGKDIPYKPAWAADGERVYIASSAEALHRQLQHVAKNGPPLLTNPTFVKSLKNSTPDERKGLIVYADMKSLLTVAAKTFGSAIIQNAAGNPPLQDVLNTVPKSEEVLKDIPPLVGGLVDRKDQVQAIMRGPLPPLVFLTLAAIAAGHNAKK